MIWLQVANLGLGRNGWGKASSHQLLRTTPPAGTHPVGPVFASSSQMEQKKTQRRLRVSMWDWGQAEEADTCLRHVEGRGDVPR